MGPSLCRPTVTHCHNGICSLICCYSCFLSQGKEVVLESEVQVLSRLRHPNVVKLYDVIDASSILCLVLELVEVNNAKPSLHQLKKILQSVFIGFNLHILFIKGR